MKLKTHTCFAAFFLAALVLALAPGVTQAIEIASTMFSDDGNDGTIAGDTSGTGWAAGGWTVADQALAGLIVAESMAYQVPGGGLVQASSAVAMRGNLPIAIERNLASPQNGDDIYISFLTKWDDDSSPLGGEITNNDFAVWYFNDNSGPLIGYKANQGFDGPAELSDFVARTNGGTNMYAEENLVIGETYFVVGHLSKTVPGPGNVYDRYELWVNPALNASGSPEAVSDGDSNISEFTNVGVRTFGINFDTQGDDVLFGALTIGTTWADVVPPPTISGDIHDLDNDDDVDPDDFNILGANLYGHLDGLDPVGNGDFNFDGRIDLGDVGDFKNNHFAAFAAATRTPEPTTMVLSLILFSVLAYRGRSRRL